MTLHTAHTALARPAAAPRTPSRVAHRGLRPLPPRGAQVHIGGWVRQPLALDARTLDAMDWMLVQDFDVVCTLDGSHGVVKPVRAVRLCELIERAQPAFAQRTDFKRVAVVAEGAEGYRALFSWAEIFNSPLGSGIVLAYDWPGHQLPANAGRFALMARHDLATGPRYVRQLQRVELHKLW